MKDARDHIEALVQLPRLRDDDERHAAWRQSIASLVNIVENARRPVPLEGISPEALRRAVASAIEHRYIDDLSWLSGSGAAAALYELASALPPGAEKKDLGRRVLSRLHQSSAPAFVGLATRLALGSRRALMGPSIRARVALALELPSGSGVRVDELALALISRKELERDWLAIPSTGALPARRLAARLLERAASAAVARAAEGDDSGLRVFRLPTVEAAWARLLADRESLVWRHAAIARGLLSTSEPLLAEEIEEGLDPSLSPTEWRRAATSLAASLALDPEGAFERSEAFLLSDVLLKDPGTAGSMILGLAPASSAHPAAAETLLEQLVKIGGVSGAEALSDLLREGGNEQFGRRAADSLRRHLAETLEGGTVDDDGQHALMLALLDELDQRTVVGPPPLRQRLFEALSLFVEEGADPAYRAASVVLSEVQAQVRRLHSSSVDDHEGRVETFRILRDLDQSLFATDLLSNLLTLGSGTKDPSDLLSPVADIFEKLARWLVTREAAPLDPSVASEHFRLRLGRLTSLLHLVDADGRQIEDRSERLRSRRLLAARTLIDRARRERKNGLRRALCAATARAGDAMIREDFAEISDVLISAAKHLPRPADLNILAEASMLPEFEAPLRAYASLEGVVTNAPQTGPGIRGCLDSLAEVANALPVATSPRVEALRGSLIDYELALTEVAAVRSLSELCDHEGSRHIGRLGQATQALARLVVGARRRLGESEAQETPSSGAALRRLQVAIERRVDGETNGFSDTFMSVAETLARELPHALSEVAILTLERVNRLEVEAASVSQYSFLPGRRKEAPLPPWMPFTRKLGGFYILRPLGSGAVGSVFLSRRGDAKNPELAERFALKVPEFDGAAAHSLSEEEFLRLFRDEAGALLALPAHEHLARFVTFDAGARPKPILVMELVEGPTLERRLELGGLTVRQAFSLLDGVCSGLEAMHDAGLGHLDVKPSNVILRPEPGTVGSPGTSVLVDFGLAGRQLRPGCATANYGAPEIWENQASIETPTPQGADVYALGCMIYEVLTRRTLFDGPNPMALIHAHFRHDGSPPEIASLLEDPSMKPLGTLIQATLRRRSADRIDISRVRLSLNSLLPRYAEDSWPLSIPG